MRVGAPIVAIDTAATTGEVSLGDGDATDAALADAGAPPAAPASDQSAEPAERTPVLVGYGPRTASVTRRPRKLAVPVATAGPAAGGTATAAASAVDGAGQTVPLAKPPVRKLARDLGGSAHPGRQRPRRLDHPAACGGGRRHPRRTGHPRTSGAVQIKGFRRSTADNVTASAFTAPHVTVFLTVDATRAMRALRRLTRVPEWRDVRVSPLLLVAKAVLLAIKRHPMINSTWDQAANEIVMKDYVNLGIAAATDRGLIVPNIKDADQLSLRELAEALTSLVNTAKAGRTTLADMSGGTFTITNIGVFGVDTGTPILPVGEAAILALGAIQERPWVHKGRSGSGR